MTVIVYLYCTIHTQVHSTSYYIRKEINTLTIDLKAPGTAKFHQMFYCNQKLFFESITFHFFRPIYSGGVNIFCIVQFN